MSSAVDIKIVSIIGSRELTQEDHALLVATARWLVMNGRMVVTGGAYGADQAGMEGAVLGAQESGRPLNECLRVYLPWRSYNEDIVPAGADIHCGGWTPEHIRLAKLHPRYDYLKQGAQKMMNRNSQIICDTTSTVIALPRMSGSKPQGGTAHGILAAKDIGKGVLNVALPEIRKELVRLISYEPSEARPVKPGHLHVVQMSQLTRTGAKVCLNIARKPIPTAGVVQKIALAPSAGLLSWYFDHKDEDWWPGYVERWNKEKEGNKAYWDEIDKIVRVLQAGGDVAIACFCKYGDRCHRSLVAKAILERM